MRKMAATFANHNKKRKHFFVAAMACVLTAAMCLTMLTGYACAQTAEGGQEPAAADQSVRKQAALSAAVITDNYIGADGPWEVVDMAAAGQETKTDRKAFFRSALETIKDTSSTTRSTDMERTAIALTSIGIDITRIQDENGKNYNLLDMIVNDPAELNVNGMIFGLIAVDSGAYDIPADAKWTRSAYLKAILDAQLADGSWNWSKSLSSGDVDMTAMAVTALAPYTQTRPDVKAAVDDAFVYIRNKQLRSGDFGPNANTTAMVVLAYLSVGIDPETITFLDAAEQNPMAQLFKKYSTTDGGFGYKNNSARNGLATEQVYRALVTYLRFKDDAKPVSPYVFAKPAAGSIEELTGSTDRQEPTIETTLKDEKTTAETCSFTVTAKDDSDENVQLVVRQNGRTVEGTDGNYSIKLVSGKNEIDVITWDSAANMTKKTYTVTYETSGNSGSGGAGGGMLPATPEESLKATFCLEGDTAHGDKGGTHTLAGGNLQTWISETSISVSKGNTVGDVFRKVLTEKGYTYEAKFSGNYIKSITTPSGVTLAEFTNGKNSGWMYTVNGTHPEVGLNEYVLTGGERIVWHYTDDYTKEEGSDKWNTPGDDKKDDPAVTDPSDDQQTPAEEDAAAKAVKAKKLVASLKLTATSAKTAKKNVKITIKMNKKSDDSVKELKTLGYALKYRYYRSTKKTTGYRSSATRSAKAYVSTSGTNGRRYYYKVQVRVYDENGKLTARSALKQCRYAARIWGK